MTLTDNIIITKLRHWYQKSLLTSHKHFRLRTIQVSYNSIVNSAECRILCLETTICGQQWLSVTIWRKLLQNRIECLSKLTVSMLLVNHFTSYENVRKCLDDWYVSKERQFFWRGIHQLPDRWEKCIASDGQYFE